VNITARDISYMTNHYMNGIIISRIDLSAFIDYLCEKFDKTVCFSEIHKRIKIILKAFDVHLCET